MNFKNIALFVLIFSLVAGVFSFALADHDPFGGVSQTSVNICHSTGNNGGYIINSPDISGTGGNVNLQGHEGHPNDIIPPFHYEGGSYEGKNWDSQTSQIWNEGNCDGDIEPLPVCSDNQDNDSDNLVDSADPGCHTDGDVNNSSSYDPNDNDETDEINQYCPGDGELSLDEFWNAVSLGKVEYDLEVASNLETALAVVSNDTGCTIPMSLSVYKMYDQDLSHQTLFDKDGVRPAGEGETVFTVDLPSCMAQIDFWYGDAPTTLVSDGNAYVTNTPPRVLLWAFIYNTGSSYWNAAGQFCTHDAENLPPVANAGVDQTLTLPVNSTSLDASGSSDSDGTIISYVWDFVSGSSNINPDDLVNPNLIGLVAGTYVFQLTVTDNDGATGTDTVSITINPEIVLPECSDDADNDSDSLIDELDPGCHSDGDVNNPNSYDPNDDNELEQTSLPECSDNVDNSDAEDTLVDSADPGCHTDGNANNSNSYDPNDNNETNEGGGGGGNPPACSDDIDNDGDGDIDYPNDEGCEDRQDDSEDNRRVTGGGGGGFRRSTGGEVLGAQSVCNFSIDTYMRRGYDNNKEQVKVLQTLLNKYVSAGLAIDGIYGPKTEAAVKVFQLKYKDNVLTPWDLESPTGIFFRTTLVQAQNLECVDNQVPIPTNLINWSQSPNEVPVPLPVPIPLSFNYFYGI